MANHSTGWAFKGMRTLSFYIYWTDVLRGNDNISGIKHEPDSKPPFKKCENTNL